MEKKIKKKHIDYSCGFPVVLLNVPMIKVHGSWILDIDYDALAKVVLLYISKKQESLTGNEIRFIRYYFSLPMREFAHRLGVTHPTVVKWEERQDKHASITWGIEKDIRLFILDKLVKSSKDFREGYKSLEAIESFRSKRAKIEPFSIEIHDGHLQMAG